MKDLIDEYKDTWTALKQGDEEHGFRGTQCEERCGICTPKEEPTGMAKMAQQWRDLHPKEVGEITRARREELEWVIMESLGIRDASDADEFRAGINARIKELSPSVSKE